VSGSQKHSLGEAAARVTILRLECTKSGRAGRYWIDHLIERFGPDIALLDLRHELAQCPRWHSMGEVFPSGSRLFLSASV
jgi:hypothetical protein